MSGARASEYSSRCEADVRAGWFRTYVPEPDSHRQRAAPWLVTLDLSPRDVSVGAVLQARCVVDDFGTLQPVAGGWR